MFFALKEHNIPALEASQGITNIKKTLLALKGREVKINPNGTIIIQNSITCGFHYQE